MRSRLFIFRGIQGYGYALRAVTEALRAVTVGHGTSTTEPAPGIKVTEIPQQRKKKHVQNRVWHFGATHSGPQLPSLKIMIFSVASQVFYFSGHAGKRQVVPARALALENSHFADLFACVDLSKCTL